MKNQGHSIAQIFPSYEGQIDFLFQTDENFRELCSDYLLCAGMVGELKKETKRDTIKLEEYEELKLSLEQEILETITAK